MTRALVTGAAGFIGSHVVDHCLALGMEVTAVDDLSGGCLENVSLQADWVKGDVRDPAFVDALWAGRRFDYVYHLAAYAAEGLSHFIRRYNYETNLIGSVNLINASIRADVECFVFTSSIAVYGASQVPMTEDIDPRPEDPYGVSKYAVELDLRAAQDMFGLRHVIFRPHNVYGERQNISDPYRNVVGIFMNQMLYDRPMTIFGDGLQTRAFSHIDDVAPLIARAPLVERARNRVFNVGSDVPCTVVDLAHEVAAAFGKRPTIRHLDARREVRDAFADHRRVKDVFQPCLPRSLGDGVRQMAEWVRRNGSARPVSFDAVEIERNLPRSWAKTVSVEPVAV